MKKIINPEEFNSIRPGSLKVVFTNGCFDILHKGHVEYLRKAKEHGDLLVIGVNSDSSISRIKGNKRPIMELENRCAVLEAFEFVDFLIVFDEDTPQNLIEMIKPDVLVKGADYKIDDIVGGRFVIDNGGIVKTIKLEDGFSTSSIIDTIIKRYCK